MRTVLTKSMEADPIWAGNAPAVAAGESIMVPDGARHMSYLVKTRAVIVREDEWTQYLVVSTGQSVQWA